MFTMFSSIIPLKNTITNIGAEAGKFVFCALALVTTSIAATYDEDNFLVTGLSPSLLSNILEELASGRPVNNEHQELNGFN